MLDPTRKVRHGVIKHADGTVQTLNRRTPAGTSVPITQTGRTWQELVTPAAPPTGGARLDQGHPSRKHDTTARPTVVPADVEHDTSGVRRRDRRTAARTARRAA